MGSGVTRFSGAFCISSIFANTAFKAAGSPAAKTSPPVMEAITPTESGGPPSATCTSYTLIPFALRLCAIATSFPFSRS